MWDSSTASYVTHRVYAPELVAIAKKLARKRLAPVEKIMVAPPDGGWLEE
jgi:hypothetical protein